MSVPDRKQPTVL